LPPHWVSSLRRQIRGNRERMLAQTLQELKANGFVLRPAHAVVPPRAGDALTPLGTGAAQPVVALVTWVAQNLSKVVAAQSR
jgi:DNA-binding HxlR family transcriptional regulator